MTNRFLLPAMGVLLMAAAPPVRAADPPAAPPAPPSVTAQLKRDVAALRPLVKTPVARGFLDAAADLPAPRPRTLYRDPATRALLSEASAAKLEEATRKTLTPAPVPETVYYNTKYGTPLAYARPLEILGAAGFGDLRGKRVLDFGYGTIGHLRAMAQRGADAVGVDVDPFLRELYSLPEDTGRVTGANGSVGSVTLIDGQFPADAAVAKAVGGGYDLILSKNTLKNGYIHPAAPVDKRMLVDLGVSDEKFVAALFAALKPGGRVLLYNLSPAPAKPGQPYIPWADGRSPFPREKWEKAGFKVVAFDVSDDVPARAMARALGWDKGQKPMDVDNDLFAHYTLVERPK